MKSIRIFCIIAILFVSTNIKANNIVISNISSVIGSGFVQLQFDLSWENSWNNAINRDAAWVFFKFKDRDGTWQHLNLTNANNVITAGFAIQVPTDLTGAFIYRNSGSGTNTLTGVQVGVSNLPGSFDIKGFAIEMVRLPLNATYSLGDGSGGFRYQTSTTVEIPYLVNTNTITMGTTAGLLNDVMGNGALATGFPIGYTGLSTTNLYMMKHEISQGAYRDFLNTLTYNQQVTRTGVAPNSAAGTLAMDAFSGSYRNRLEIATPGINSTTPAVYGCDFDNDAIYNEATDGEWIACSYLAYMDVAAFLDWAALRPMTELEFEKACRGPLTPVNAENAAGTNALYTGIAWSISNGGANNEIVTTYSGSVLNANITYTGVSPSGVSPLRVGIHATPFATRISAGAGYYGALDLTGNINEIAVTTHSVAGRSYTGVSGNGTLNALGEADEDFWPGINNNTTTGNPNLAYAGVWGVTGAAGFQQRGGSANSAAGNVTVSIRNPGAGTSTRTLSTGGRGVKSW